MRAVRLSKPSVMRIADVRLGPGLNHLSDDQWKRVSEDRIGKARIESGVIRVEDSGDSGKQPSAQELVKQIRQMTDPKQLEQYTDDSRKSVAQAASDRLAEIQQYGETSDE